MKENSKNEAIRILMLEDRPEDVFLVERALNKGNLEYHKHVVDTEGAFIQGLKDFSPDIILSDHSLPQFSSKEALRLSKAIKPSVPFILVTGTVSEEFAINVLKKGANDYILKTNLKRLVPAIRQALKQKELQKKKELAEETLMRRNTELKRVNDELDRFVYSASHDLRSPLTGIMGLMSLARQHVANPTELEDYLIKMQHSIEKLDNILSDILEYSYNARFEVTYEEIDLKLLIDECLGKVEHLPGFDQIEKRVTIKQDAKLISDRYRLSTIFSSLFKNTIHFLDSNKKPNYFQLDIAVSDQLFISFQDNGVGIKKSGLAKVFDMFYRGSSNSKGAGLGLYITKEIITKLKGEIEVKSVYGEYTAFTITLPIPKTYDLNQRKLLSS